MMRVMTAPYRQSVSSPHSIVYREEVDTAQSILDWLIKQFPTAKRQTLKRMVQAGRVTVNGRKVATLKHPLTEADRVGVDEGPPARPAKPPNTLRIVYEDEDILVLDKPIGLLTSTVPREPRPTLWAIAKEFIQGREPTARVGLIHRLDRDASGLLVFSKNDGALSIAERRNFSTTQFTGNTLQSSMGFPSRQRAGLNRN